MCVCVCVNNTIYTNYSSAHVENTKYIIYKHNTYYIKRYPWLAGHQFYKFQLNGSNNFYCYSEQKST